jgi:hypothetical protein
MSTVGVVVGNVGVARKLRVDLGVGLDALKAVLNVVLLSLGFICRRRSLEFALSSNRRLR